MASTLVIGGTRYMGLEITKRLAKDRSERVYVLNRGATKSKLPDGVERITCDISNIPNMISKVSALSPDVVIDTVLNSPALEQLLQSLGGKLKRFIHTGSIGVYEGAGFLPAREEDEAKPSFSVFKEKLAQDEVVLRHVKQFGLPATVLRVSYIFGRGDVPLELWGGRNPEFYRALQRNEEILVPGDGKTLLHPGHFRDLASSFLLCLENEASIGKVYNIAGDRNVTLEKYLEIIGEALQVKPKVDRRPVSEAATTLVDRGLADMNDLLFAMEHMSVDISKAKSELGYSPAIALEDGMKDNIEWMREEGLIN
ncbi:MAG: NAD-dependent epimerase/dehydratase family protein [Armatimonadota bacterium]